MSELTSYKREIINIKQTYRNEIQELLVRIKFQNKWRALPHHICIKVIEPKFDILRFGLTTTVTITTIATLRLVPHDLSPLEVSSLFSEIILIRVRITDEFISSRNLKTSGSKKRLHRVKT